MSTTNAQKIGQMISQVRRQRGMTQADLATALNTSQSAINK